MILGPILQFPVHGQVFTSTFLRLNFILSFFILSTMYELNLDLQAFHVQTSTFIFEFFISIYILLHYRYKPRKRKFKKYLINDFFLYNTLAKNLYARVAQG